MVETPRSSKAGATPLRERSEKLVLEALQRHGFTHAKHFQDDGFTSPPLATIAATVGLSRPSVYNVRDAYGSLLNDMRLKPEVGYAIGVDLGPRHARVALGDIHGQLFAPDDDRFERTFDLGRPPEEYLDWATKKIDELLRAAKVEPGEIIGIGTSQVAPIHVSTGRPHPSGLANKAWRDVNVGDQIARRLEACRPEWKGVDTGISDNDTNLSLLAEHTFGSAAGAEHIIYVNWSNHVGFGLILANHPYRGSRGYAGELGHLLIREDELVQDDPDWPHGEVIPDAELDGDDPQAKKCLRCGKEGCLELLIGAGRLAMKLKIPEKDMPWAADRLVKRVNSKPVGFEDFERDLVARRARLLGQSVASVVDILDPSVLVLGGSLGGRLHDDTALLRAFREGLEERMMGFANEIEIRQPDLPHSAVRGAILRVLEERLADWALKKVTGPSPTSSGRAAASRTTA